MITQYVGGYSDYQARQALFTAQAETKEVKPAAAKSAPTTPARTARRFTFNEQREYDTIDALIAGVEQELQTITDEIAAAGSDFARLQSLTDRQTALTTKLDELLERWTYLNELAEEIQNQGRQS